ncbi:GNAT family N-acetyltransferase [Nocardia concava]|uniref:GNAT family N-acetyltransferase n=1 Tax=Nocardia concava TaxID=257281 RepID=UPI00031833F2|nr:GNAT family protein [Nocardia concava]
MALVLSGKIVQLTELSVEDVPFLAAGAVESRESYAFAHLPADEDGMRRLVEQQLAARDANRQLPLVMRWAGTGKVIGSSSFHLEQWPWHSEPPATPDAVEIGSTWLAHSAQRTGANREAKLLMLDHAFTTWQVHRVRFRTDVRNERSRRAIERLGAQFDGILRGDFAGADGTVRNSAYYSILAAEWGAVRSVLADSLALR